MAHITCMNTWPLWGPSLQNVCTVHMQCAWCVCRWPSWLLELLHGQIQAVQTRRPATKMANLSPQTHKNTHCATYTLRGVPYWLAGPCVNCAPGWVHRGGGPEEEYLQSACTVPAFRLTPGQMASPWNPSKWCPLEVSGVCQHDPG